MWRLTLLLAVIRLGYDAPGVSWTSSPPIVKSWTPLPSVHLGGSNVSPRGCQDQHGCVHTTEIANSWLAQRAADTLKNGHGQPCHGWRVPRLQVRGTCALLVQPDNALAEIHNFAACSVIPRQYSHKFTELSLRCDCWLRRGNNNSVCNLGVAHQKSCNSREKSSVTSKQKSHT